MSSFTYTRVKTFLSSRTPFLTQDAPRSALFSELLGWAPEIVACGFSVALGVSIVILLQWYDGKPQPELPVSLTLNTILQFLATFAQFAFATAVSKILSQLKWLWFAGQEHRPLSNFQAYDDACRGGWGSLFLLWRLRGPGAVKKIPTHLAAIVLISAVFTAPVTQQVISYRVALHPASNGTASVQRTTTLSRTVGNNIKPAYGDLYAVRDAVISAAYLGPLVTVPQLEPSCSSADCSWEPYGSLGICSSTVNVTDPDMIGEMSDAVWRGFTTVYNNTAYLNSTLPDVPLYHTIVLPFASPSGLFDNSTLSTAVEFFFAYSDGLWIHNSSLDMSRFHYLAFSLYYCTKLFNTSVAAGRATTLEVWEAPGGGNGTNNTATSSSSSSSSNTGAVVLASSTQYLNPLWNTDMSNFTSTNDTYCPLNVLAQSVTLAAPPGESAASSGENDGNSARYNYSIDACTGIAMADVIEGAASSLTILDPKVQIEWNQGELALPLSVALYADNPGQTAVTDPVTRFRNVARMIENVATSLTNILRESGTTQVGSRGPVAGTAYTPQLIVQVRWAWMTLLAAQIALTAAALGWAVALTRASGVPPFKDSSLAALCALDPLTRRALGPLRGSGTGGSGSGGGATTTTFLGIRGLGGGGGTDVGDVAVRLEKMRSRSSGSGGGDGLGLGLGENELGGSTMSLGGGEAPAQLSRSGSRGDSAVWLTASFISTNNTSSSNLSISRGRTDVIQGLSPSSSGSSTYKGFKERFAGYNASGEDAV